MTRRTLALGAALALAAAAPAVALPGYSVNPNGTDALVNGTLIVRQDLLDDRACINVGLLTADPPTPADGDVWIVHTIAEHRLCFRAAGVTHCMTATATP